LPELPEVETIKNELSPHVVGRLIKDVRVLWERTVRKPSVPEFLAGVKGQRITDLDRRGKYLIFQLSGGKALIIHLRMTGSLLVKPASETPEKYVRAAILLDDGMAIHFRDVRKLGGMWLEESRQAIDVKLGVEPLSAEFTSSRLGKLLAGRSAPIKALLLDQSIIAGVGNMYADEALFYSRIHPERKGGSLTAGEIKQLHRAIRAILRAAIADKGASINSYFRPDGSQGTAHFEFRVAHRGGEKCPRCGGTIKRIVVRNRGTYFCPRCQT
jgi:formamidopyrimidine-DNA glycosylase